MNLEKDALVRPKNPDIKLFAHAPVDEVWPLAGGGVIIVVATKEGKLACLDRDLEVVANIDDLVEATERETGLVVRGNMRRCYTDNVRVVSFNDGETTVYNCLPHTVKRCKQPAKVVVSCRDEGVASSVAWAIAKAIRREYGFTKVTGCCDLRADVDVDTPIEVTHEVKS